MPNHLRVFRNLPQLPGSLPCSEELKVNWNSLLQRTGRKLGQAWRQEFSPHAKKQRDRFKEKEERARVELETLEDTLDSIDVAYAGEVSKANNEPATTLP